ncbi:SEL1-like repeat protein, partial [Planktomarina temperata]|nr:SEL1-like repeat protein [Planktomarina temperata]
MCCTYQIKLLLVALSIFWGTGAAANYKKAKRFFDQNNYEAALIEANRSAQNGDADSLNLLGVMYEAGLGVETNLSKAVSNFELAIEQKSAKALLNLGRIYSSKKNGLMDKKKAENLLLLAVSASNRTVSTDASFALGLLYYFNKSFNDHEFKATKYLTLAADNMHVDAIKALGHLAETQTAAFYWYAKASELNDPEAEFLTGRMLFQGIGTEKNIQRSITFFTKSASKDYLAASEFLGKIYGFNYLAKNDYPKAIFYLQKATKQGSIPAQINLATLYRVLSNYQKSKEILTKIIIFLETQTPQDLDLIAHTTNALATTQFEMGEYNAAEMLFIKSISIAEQLHGYQSAELTGYYSDIAAFYGKINARALAQKYFIKALSNVDEKNDFDYYFAISNNYSLFLAENDQTQGAIETLESLAEKLKIRSGAYTQKLSPVHYNLGIQYKRVGEIDKARQNFKNALEINLNHYGKWHDDNSRILIGIAELYQFEKKYAAARLEYQKSMEIFQHVYNGEHPEILRLILKIAGLERLQNQEKLEVKSLLEFKDQLIQLRQFGRFNLISSDSNYSFNSALIRLMDLLFTTDDNSLIFNHFETLQLLNLSSQDKQIEYGFATLDTEKSAILKDLKELRANQRSELYTLENSLSDSSVLENILEIDFNIR